MAEPVWLTEMVWQIQSGSQRWYGRSSLAHRDGMADPVSHAQIKSLVPYSGLVRIVGYFRSDFFCQNAKFQAM